VRRLHGDGTKGNKSHEGVAGRAQKRFDALAVPPAGEEEASKPPGGSRARDR
jgi:hypothetical protein